MCKSDSIANHNPINSWWIKSIPSLHPGLNMSWTLTCRSSCWPSSRGGIPSCRKQHVNFWVSSHCRRSEPIRPYSWLPPPPQWPASALWQWWTQDVNAPPPLYSHLPAPEKHMMQKIKTIWTTKHEQIVNKLVRWECI